MDWENDENIAFLSDESVQMQVLFVGGGNAYVLFRTGELCEYVNRALAKYVLEHTYSLNLAVAVVEKTEDYSFGSLGHSACSDCVNVTGGNILKCNITGITKGIKGYPGEKKASLDKTIIGSVKYNNDFGVSYT